jgi:sn-glycerol 3-phosphate transport system ATP-binding protein
MEVFARPATMYVAGFIGAPAMNFLPATLVAGHAATLPNGYDAAKVTVGIRPEHVTLDPAGLALAVELVEPLGSETLVHGRLADGTPLLVKLDGAVPIGEQLRVGLPPAALHLFDSGTGKRLDAMG